jgi:hypothetical protein
LSAGEPLERKLCNGTPVRKTAALRSYVNMVYDYGERKELNLLSG